MIYPHRKKMFVVIETMSKGYIKNQLKKIQKTNINIEYKNFLDIEYKKRRVFRILK